LVRSANISSSAVAVINALNALLFTSGASRKSGTAVRIEQTFYTFALCQRAGRRSRRAIRVGFTSEREDAKRVIAADSSSSFGSSPVVKRTVNIAGALDAASSFKVAVGKAVRRAVIIRGTEVYANVGERIAVRLVRDFTTIVIASITGTRSASYASTISLTIRDGSRAIGVYGARSASSVI